VLNRINALFNRVDELTLRERAVVLGGLLTLLFLGWYTYLMEPILKQEKSLLAELETKRKQLQTLNEQFEMLADSRKVDPNEASRQRLAGLKQEEARIREELQSATEHLVAPELMPDVLRQVLKSAQGLTLVKLNGLGSTPLVQPASKAGAEPPVGAAATTQQTGGTGTGQGGGTGLEGAYKHGMQIQFNGDFFSTMEYMRQLEQLQWRFFWDSINFAVGEYPEATTSIRLFTLSLKSNWIGT